MIFASGSFTFCGNTIYAIHSLVADNHYEVAESAVSFWSLQSER